MLDMMAVGHADGCIVLVDLKRDVAVMRLQHDDGAVSRNDFATTLRVCDNTHFV